MSSNVLHTRLQKRRSIVEESEEKEEGEQAKKTVKILKDYSTFSSPQRLFRPSIFFVSLGAAAGLRSGLADYENRHGLKTWPTVQQD